MSLSTFNFRLLTLFTLISIIGVFFYLASLNSRISYLEVIKALPPLAEKSIDGRVNNYLFDNGKESSYYLNLDIYDSAREKRIIIYNRVPKTGSTSFMGLAYDLCEANHFNVVHLNTSKNSHVLSLTDQAYFVKNITTWMDKRPAIYHGHIAYLDFSRFGVPDKPIYINIIREPLERFISHYYFLRYGDNFRPNVVRRRQGNKITFDECVKEKGKDCDPKNMWLQIPFFCGHVYNCWIPGNEWALQEAKRNLIQNYFLVGVSEQMHEFVAILEYALPNYFRGALKKYELGAKSYLRKTNFKSPPFRETVDLIKQSKIWQMENEFYLFVLQQFDFVKQRTIEKQEQSFIEKERQFFYEKIRPKKGK